MTSCLLSYTAGLFWNGLYAKQKYVLRLETNMFLLEYTHLRKGDKNRFDGVASPESVSIPLNVYFHNSITILIQKKCIVIRVYSVLLQVLTIYDVGK